MNRHLTPAHAAFLAQTFARNRTRFGGWSMEEPSEAEKAAAEKAAAEKAAAEDAKNKFEPITSQDDLDRRLGERLQRERAKFADYADLKKKADAHDKAMADAMTEQEKAVKAAKDEGRTEAQTAASTRLVSAEARALAAGEKFRDPSDAVKFLDLKVVNVGDDGEVDSKAISDQLKTLAETKPYLVDDGKGTRPKPDNSQGNARKDKAGGGSVAQVMADRRAAREAKTSTNSTS